MSSPLLLDIFATQYINARLAEAAQDALADQLPHSSESRPDVVARQYLASGLRALATRLDPCLDLAAPGEPTFIIVSHR
jgi:hypothetical protein